MFYDYQRIIPELRDDNEIVINIGGDLEDYIQDAYLEIAAFDEDNDTITYYGTEDCCEYDGEDPDFASTFKTNTELLPGDTIIPIINVQDASGQKSSDSHGKAIKYKVNSKIELMDLPDGDYVQSVVVTDMRGDKYYSPVVEANCKNGKVSGLELNPEFIGTGN